VRQIDGEDAARVNTYLQEQGLFVIYIRPTQQIWSSFSLRAKRVSHKEIIDITRQFAIMMNAGLTIVQSLDILKRQAGRPALKELIDDIDHDVKSGSTFSDAINRKSHLFSNLYISLVKSGEATGKLAEVMAKLAENMESSAQFQAKLKNALIYPVIVLLAMFGVMFIMVTFVVPKLTELYTQFDATLPLPTQILIAISQFMVAFWPLVLLALAGVYYGSRMYVKTKQGRMQYDTVMTNLPVVGSVVRMGALVNSTRTLSILVGSGISILDALKIVHGTTDNILYQRAFENIYKQVEKGTSLGSAFEHEAIFPPILIQMITIGENTGHLDETLERISVYFEQESELAIKAMTTLIEPAILLVLGVGVGFIVFSIITPIYSLTSSIK
jgi:type II secretory pathway component PulF